MQRKSSSAFVYLLVLVRWSFTNVSVISQSSFIFSWPLIADALQKLASVSATPGHTQAFHFFSLTRRAQQTRDILPQEHVASSEAHTMLDAQVCLNALDHTKHFE